jgi:hypothetical protein
MDSNETESALQEIEHLKTVLGQQGNPTHLVRTQYSHKNLHGNKF